MAAARAKAEVGLAAACGYDKRGGLMTWHEILCLTSPCSPGCSSKSCVTYLGGGGEGGGGRGGGDGGGGGFGGLKKERKWEKWMHG